MEGKGRGQERGGEGKVKGSGGERRWREGFGPPKSFGVAPPMMKPLNGKPLASLVYRRYRA